MADRYQRRKGKRSCWRTCDQVEHSDSWVVSLPDRTRNSLFSYGLYVIWLHFKEWEHKKELENQKSQLVETLFIFQFDPTMNPYVTSAEG